MSQNMSDTLNQDYRAGCGCGAASIELEKDFTVDGPVFKIKQIMCSEHTREMYGDIIGSIGTS